MKGKCSLGPFLSILVIECQHKCLSENICQMLDKVQIKSKGMFLSAGNRKNRIAKEMALYSQSLLSLGAPDSV
jgi:hypothetical protein